MILKTWPIIYYVMKLLRGPAKARRADSWEARVSLN